MDNSKIDALAQMLIFKRDYPTADIRPFYYCKTSLQEYGLFSFISEKLIAVFEVESIESDSVSFDDALDCYPNIPWHQSLIALINAQKPYMAAQKEGRLHLSTR